MPRSKKVSAGMASSVTTSRFARPSMSGQYSSSVPVDVAPFKKRTGLPKLDDNLVAMFLSSVETVLPSGKVIQTDGKESPSNGSANAARKLKSVGHLEGFFALAIFPVSASAMAKARSP